jgi:hypothetical protein
MMVGNYWWFLDDINMAYQLVKDLIDTHPYINDLICDIDCISELEHCTRWLVRILKSEKDVLTKLSNI